MPALCLSILHNSNVIRVLSYSMDQTAYARSSRPFSAVVDV